MGNAHASPEQALCLELENARTAQRAVLPLVSRYPGLTVDSAYRVQQAGIAARTAAGARRIGHKIGLTSQAMQRQLGVDQPDYGTLLDSMVVESGSTVTLDDLIAPRIEAEIAVRMRSPLGGDSVLPEQALAAIECVVPALEIIDSRIADWQISLVDTIADNASSALVVVGRPAGPFESTDLRTESVVLYEGDRVAGQGDGAALLGDPVNSLIWLTRALAALGASLDAGELVLLGAVHASVPLHRGQHFRAVYRSGGQVDCRIQ